MEKIFLRLSAQFGSKIADLFGGVPPEEVKAEWGSALADYHPTEIQRGLAASQTRRFAPVLGEFLQLCRPALDPETAWHEAQDGLRARGHGAVGEWSHPAVWRACSAFQFELSAGTFAQHRKAWCYLLDREFRAGWGEDVQEPLQQIAYRPRPMAAPPKPTTG